MKFNYKLYRPKKQIPDAAVKISSYFKRSDVTASPLSKIGDLADMSVQQPPKQNIYKRPIFRADFDRSRLRFKPLSFHQKISRLRGGAHAHFTLLHSRYAVIAPVAILVVITGGKLAAAGSQAVLNNLSSQNTGLHTAVATPPANNKPETKKSQVSKPKTTPQSISTPAPTPTQAAPANNSSIQNSSDSANPSYDTSTTSGNQSNASASTTIGTPTPSDTPTPTQAAAPTPTDTPAVMPPAETPSPTTTPTVTPTTTPTEQLRGVPSISTKP